jgi:predicted nucleotidyltransferase
LPEIPGESMIQTYIDKVIELKGDEDIMIDEHSIQELCEDIVRVFQPDKIILFGSYASGTPTPDSDVDMLVVLPFEGKNFRKSLEILNHTNPRFPIDLLARNPEDTERRYREGDPLIREALDHGRVMYERHRSRSRPGI